jgi:hypothetical protein
MYTEGRMRDVIVTATLIVSAALLYQHYNVPTQSWSNRVWDEFVDIRHWRHNGEQPTDDRMPGNHGGTVSWPHVQSLIDSLF